MKASWFAALLFTRCPMCHTGRIFRGPMDMNAQCPRCRYVFEREPGYFLGSLVIGYAFAIVGVSVLALAVRVLLPALDWEWCFFAGFGLYIPLTPSAFRLSRTIWMYFDHWLDPPRH